MSDSDKLFYLDEHIALPILTEAEARERGLTRALTLDGIVAFTLGAPWGGWQYVDSHAVKLIEETLAEIQREPKTALDQKFDALVDRITREFQGQKRRELLGEALDCIHPCLSPRDEEMMIVELEELERSLL